MKSKIFLALVLLPLAGCYSKQRFARVALESSQPILSDYRDYLEKDTAMPADRKALRLDTVNDFENYLKEGAGQ